MGFRSGDREGQCIGPPRPIHRPWNFSSIKLRTRRPCVVMLVPHVFFGGQRNVLQQYWQCLVHERVYVAAVRRSDSRYGPMIQSPSWPAHTLRDQRTWRSLSRVKSGFSWAQWCMLCVSTVPIWVKCDSSVHSSRVTKSASSFSLSTSRLQYCKRCCLSPGCNSCTCCGLYGYRLYLCRHVCTVVLRRLCLLASARVLIPGWSATMPSTSSSSCHEILGGHPPIPRRGFRCPVSTTSRYSTRVLTSSGWRLLRDLSAYNIAAT
jgi:hypothetical protein